MLPINLFNVALSLQLLVPTASKSANTVDFSFNRKWHCEGDIDVRLNEVYGILWILVRSHKIDEKLPFYRCDDSHCDWGNDHGAERCNVAPCAEVMAGRKEQQLRIKLKNFEGRCTMLKSIDKQDEFVPR
jgi:hypothetical protein